MKRSENAVVWNVPPGRDRFLIISLPPYKAWRLSIGGHDVPLYNLADDRIVAMLPQDASGEATLAYIPYCSAFLATASKAGWAVILVVFCLAVWFPKFRERHQAQG